MVAPNVKVLAEIDGEIVAVQQEQYMVTVVVPLLGVVLAIALFALGM